MMVSDYLLEQMTVQANHELNAHNGYLTMANWLEHKDWPGFAHFMFEQSKEEREHAMKFIDFINDNGDYVQANLANGKMDIREAEDVESVMDVFRVALESEMRMTDRIKDLTQIARDNNDDGALNLLLWFEEEQIEEEELMESYLNRIERAHGSTSALMQLDKECGER